MKGSQLFGGGSWLTRNLALPDDLQNHTGGPAGVGLSNHSLGHHAGLEGIIETQTTNVRVRADALNAGDVLRLGNAWSSRLQSGIWRGRRQRCAMIANDFATDQRRGSANSIAGSLFSSHQLFPCRLPAHASSQLPEQTAPQNIPHVASPQGHSATLLLIVQRGEGKEGCSSS